MGAPHHPYWPGTDGEEGDGPDRPRPGRADGGGEVWDREPHPGRPGTNESPDRPGGSRRLRMARAPCWPGADGNPGRLDGTGWCGTLSRTPLARCHRRGPPGGKGGDRSREPRADQPGRAVRGEAARGGPCGRTRRRARPTPAQPGRRVPSGAIRRRVPAGPAPATARPAASRAPTGAVPHHVPPRPAAEGTEPAAVATGEAGYRAALYRTAQRRAGPWRPRGR